MVQSDVRERDYKLTGRDGKVALEKGLVAAEWYTPNVPLQLMKQLMKRTDGPAIRDTVIYVFVTAFFAVGGFLTWGSWWCLPFFFCYAVMYGSANDARWHEAGHGTAFRTGWMNEVIYQVASFATFRNPTVWRWSHARHHTDTIIVGRDPEIVAMRPPAIWRIVSNFLAINHLYNSVPRFLLHATGRLSEEEKTFVAESEWGRVCFAARVWIAVHGGVILIAIATQSFLPLMYVGIAPVFMGSWLAHMFGLTQHAGLAENVLDHRLNSRTVYMNPIFRFLYWNMNYHVEHHMFPMVPYHRLPDLHRVLADDLPRPCTSTIDAYREIIPALFRQMKNPEWFIARDLPPNAKPFRPDLHDIEVATV